MWTPGPWPGRKKIQPHLFPCTYEQNCAREADSEEAVVVSETACGQRKRKAEWQGESKNDVASKCRAKTELNVATASLCQRLASNAIHLYTVLGETNTALRKSLQSADAVLYCDGYAQQGQHWKQSLLSTLVASTVRHGQSRTQYDKAFSCEWVNNRHVAVSTKCGRILKVDRNQRSYQEIPLEGSSWVEPPIYTDEDLHIHRVNRGGIHCIRANPSKSMLACSGGHGEDHNVFLLDLEKDKWPAIRKGVGHRDWVFTLTWLSDSVFATGSRDHSIKLWSPAASKAYCMQPLVDYDSHKAKVRCCAFDKDTDRFVSMDVQGYVFLWDPVGHGHNMSVVRKFRLENEYREECTCMLLEQNMLVVGARNQVSIYDPRQPISVLNAPLGRIPYEEEGFGIHSLAARSLSKQGPLLGIGLSSGGSVIFCDVRKFTSPVQHLGPKSMFHEPARSRTAAALNACCAPHPPMPDFVNSQARRDLFLQGRPQQHTIKFQSAGKRYNLRQRCKIKLPARFVEPGGDPPPLTPQIPQETVLTMKCKPLNLSESIVEPGLVGQPEGDVHFDEVVHSGMAVDNAVFAHNWSPDGRTLFACGGPLAMGMRGCCLSFWE